MLKQATLYSIMIVLLASCASLKTAFTGNKATASANNSTTVKKETKFLDQIDVPVESSKGGKEKESEKPVVKKETVRNSSHRKQRNLSLREYCLLHWKKAKDFEFIDDWYVHHIVWGYNWKRN
jgi:hypothetical protein